MSEDIKNQEGVVVAVCHSDTKGEKKKNIGQSLIIAEQGLEKDAHAGDWHRQVSLLAEESIEKIRKKGLDVGPGDFAENITTRGIDLLSLQEGSRLMIGDVMMEVTQLGKVCHERCAIYYQTGDCVMPREGVFARVLHGGPVQVGDVVKLLGP